ncbi:MAG: sigma-54-dependent Fis family transcriptional regulator [Pirellulales bacterium]|nr:sigma-54-dependent Fis family transcriptional regulator [Pirellulales bacterium]
MARILVIDDEQSICWGLARLGANMGHDVDTAPSAEAGLELAAANRPELLILDVRLPGQDGLAAIDTFRRKIGDIPIIIITAFGNLETAVRAIKNGAFEYVVKPFGIEEIRSVIQRALRIPPPQSPPKDLTEGIDKMLGQTPVMQEVFRQIALAAHASTSVLLRGDSGVGKELAAQAIHSHSDRSSAPFVAVNVAALSQTLAEAELFGHVEGAFTGAQRARKGLLMQANGGTLFLDEVAEIPLPIQVKLLRALDQNEVLPVGADTPVKTRFRAISATHQDLLQLVKTGKFRHDLYYRLGTFEIRIPPLREHTNDIPLLARHFANQLQAEVILAEETITELCSRPWYGNVRELRNAIEHALVVARRGIILPEHLPPPLDALELVPDDPKLHSLSDTLRHHAEILLKDPEAEGAIYNRYLEAVEHPLFQAVMAEFDSQCAPAARALGLHRTTLKRKLNQHGLDAR